ncbi:hypothetical protein AAF712_004095 [Marasmius tenuissimus]|uniref:non-specific serine/threonine protein kinase n=1 Tax=Marasmius tenuissimus TaxID=585030 RepID=A0ABR3A450_9AGAR
MSLRLSAFRQQLAPRNEDKDHELEDFAQVSSETTSVTRRGQPDTATFSARRSGFLPSTEPEGADGAHLIKAHPWFKGIDWDNIHRYPAPYRPELRHPEDTRHFDPDIPPEPLAPANGAPPDATRDPMLRDKVHGQEILAVRKALAFAGFTHKSPRPLNYARVDQAFEPEPEDAQRTIRGRSEDTPYQRHWQRPRHLYVMTDMKRLTENHRDSSGRVRFERSLLPFPTPHISLPLASTGN